MKNLDKIINYYRSIKEESANVLYHGNIAGTTEAGDDPPVDFRKKKYKKVPFFYRDIIKKLYKK